MTYEDYTTYTEVDPNSHITVATNHIDFDAYENEDAYVYDDKGTGHFNNFEHLVDGRAYTATGGDTYPCVWAVSNVVDDTDYFWDNYSQAITVDFYTNTSGVQQIRLIGAEDHVVDTWGGPSSGTWYYLTIEKSGTTVTCKIYSDSARTNLLDTLSITITNRSFQYIFACASNHWGPSNHADSDIEKLDLQEAPPAGQQLFTLINMMGY